MHHEDGGGSLLKDIVRSDVSIVNRRGGVAGVIGQEGGVTRCRELGNDLNIEFSVAGSGVFKNFEVADEVLVFGYIHFTSHRDPAQT